MRDDQHSAPTWQLVFLMLVLDKLCVTLWDEQKFESVPGKAIVDSDTLQYTTALPSTSPWPKQQAETF